MIAPVAVWPAAESPLPGLLGADRAEAANASMLTWPRSWALVGEPAGDRDDALGQMMRCRGGGIADRWGVVGSGDMADAIGVAVCELEGVRCSRAAQ